MSQATVEFIEHFGKKGMKWGTRKSKTARTTFNKAPKRLSSAELEARIKRMETEKKYNSLNRRDFGLGSRLAGEVLTNSGKKIATTVLTGAALLGVRHLLKKKFGEETAKMITKRGK